MGLMDAINPEDRIEVTKRELFDFMMYKAKTQLLINGLKNGVSPDDILKVVDIHIEKEEEK